MQKKFVDWSFSLYGQELTVTKTAGELLFDGYHDPMVALAYNVPSYLEFLFDSINPFDRVGWFYGRNNTALLSGNSTVGISAANRNLGSMIYHNFKNTTDAYTGKCSVVKGSTGEIHNQNLRRADPISIFIPDFCRDIPLDYEMDKEIAGVMGFKYVAGQRNFQNATENPANSCYYSENSDEAPSGVFNPGSCLQDAPLYLSYPHFYTADPVYLNAVEGLQPNEANHQFYMVAEPVRRRERPTLFRQRINLFILFNSFIYLIFLYRKQESH